MPQPAPLGECRFDLRIGVEHALPAEELHGLEELPARADRRVNVETVLHTGDEVVGPVPRSGVNRARSLIERYVVAKHPDRVAVVERMTKAHTFELLPLQANDGAGEGASHALCDCGRQCLGDDDGATLDVE